MTEIGAFEAKNKLSALLDEVEQGREVVITRRGRPVAKLVPVTAVTDRERQPGAAQRFVELQPSWRKNVTTCPRWYVE